MCQNVNSKTADVGINSLRLEYPVWDQNLLAESYLALSSLVPLLVHLFPCGNNFTIICSLYSNLMQARIADCQAMFYLFY